MRNELYDILGSKFGVSLDHLPAEVKEQIEQYNKPLVVNSRTFPETVAVLHKVLIEGINIEELRKQIHLDERFFYAAFPALVSLNDDRLERDLL